MSIENEELKKQLQDALKRISELETENSKLRNLISKDTHPSDLNTESSNPTENFQKHSTENSHSVSASSINATNNNQSSPENKVHLFHSLFWGRDEVFAIRWVGKDNRSGYSPACCGVLNKLTQNTVKEILK